MRRIIAADDVVLCRLWPASGPARREFLSLSRPVYLPGRYNQWRCATDTDCNLSHIALQVAIFKARRDFGAGFNLPATPHPRLR